MDPRAPYDAEIVADLQSVFGRERFLALLAGLRSEIETRLGAPKAEREQVAQDAHAMVSVSGTLGFMPLSNACAALERACLRDGDITAAVADVTAAAEEAKRAIDALIAK